MTASFSVAVAISRCWAEPRTRAAREGRPPSRLSPQEAEHAAAYEAVEWLRAEGLIGSDADSAGDAPAPSGALTLVGSKRAKDLEEDDSGGRGGGFAADGNRWHALGARDGR